MELQTRGYAVEIFERTRLLGGRATSFEIGGTEVDNGQHVYLHCCDAFVDFVQHVGMGAALREQPRFEALVLARDGTTSLLRAANLPAPLHLLASFARYAHLSIADRLRIARALASAALGRKPAAGVPRPLARRQRSEPADAPRVLGSVLHSGAQRVVRTRQRARRAVRDR